MLFGPFQRYMTLTKVAENLSDKAILQQESEKKYL